jgi:hypothetical protein
MRLISKGILVIDMAWMRQMLRWALLIAVTLAVTVPLTHFGVPSAALFAALVVGIVLALSPLPSAGRCPQSSGGACSEGLLRRYSQRRNATRHGDSISA